MIVGEGSPLRKLPTDLNRKQALWFGGIRHSIEMVELAYLHLVTELWEISRFIDSDEQEPDYLRTSAVMHAWAMVDAANRLRFLGETIPHFKQNVPSHQVFVRRLRPFENLRNPIQHLHTELLKRAETDDPTVVWGSLAWVVVDENREGAISYLMVPGTPQAGPSHPFVNPAGQEFRSRLDHVELAAYDHRVDLSGLLPALATWTAALEDELQPQFEGYESQGSDLLVALHIKFDAAENPDGGTSEPMGES